MPAASCWLTTRSSTILLQIARMLSRLNGKCGPQCEECAYTNRNKYQAINVSTNAAEAATARSNTYKYEGCLIKT